jgi:diguanylate cyclase (GGDEF)-like protein
MREQTHNNQSTYTRKAAHLEWLNDAKDIFPFLNNTGDENILDSDVNNVAMTLLKEAQSIIRENRIKIASQEKQIKNLKKISQTDELTGITNRRGFASAFEREIDRVNRDESRGGLLIMIDLDNFKSINDVYGHQAGDMALKLVASTLDNDTRKMDIVSRLGGDEFVTLFVNTTRKQALARAQFLIKKLNNLSFVWHGHEIDVRASLGLKEYTKGSTTKEILGAADADMYQNKKQLKNKPIKQNNKSMS